MLQLERAWDTKFLLFCPGQQFMLVESCFHGRIIMAKQARRVRRQPWTKQQETELRKHSRAKTPVEKIAKAMKRTAGALRQKAYGMGFPLGHRR